MIQNALFAGAEVKMYFEHYAFYDLLEPSNVETNKCHTCDYMTSAMPHFSRHIKSIHETIKEKSLIESPNPPPEL